ncbi:efflux RND transporter permease subunit [Mycoplasmatota bacterium WC44]
MVRILNYVIKRSRVVLFTSLVLLIIGIYSYVVIPKQEMPDFSTPYGVFQITAPGLSASDVEGKIVDPIEELLAEFEDVDEVRSISYESFALITVEFPYSVNNPSDIVNSMYTKILDIDLPNEVSNIDVTSDFPQHDVVYALYSDLLSEIELTNIAVKMKEKILDLNDVSYVEIDSNFEKQVSVKINKSALDALPLSFNDVYNLIYANGLEIPLGVLETDNGSIQLDVDPSYKSIEDLRDLVILPKTTPDSYAVTLGSISTITLEDVPNQKVYEFNGEKALFIGVSFSSEIDFTKLGDDLRDIVREFKIEAEGEFSVDEMNFQPDYVRKQINGVFDSLLMCVAVVMFVVMIGLGIRNSLAIVFTIPIIIFTTIAILNFNGLELEKLSIVGLIVAIGIIVDNSIVISESIQYYIDKGMSKREAAIKAVKDNSIPVFSSTITTIAAFIVIAMLPGFLGVIIKSFPITVIIALSISYVIAMFVSPVIGYLIFKEKKKKDKSLENKLKKTLYKSVLTAIKHPILITVISIELLVLSIILVFGLQPIELFPKEEKTILYVDYEYMYPGDNSGAYEFAKDIEREIIKQPKVTDYGFSQGGDLPRFHLSTPTIKELPQFGRFIIHLDMQMNEMYDYQRVLQDNLDEIGKGGAIVRCLELKQPEPPVQVYLSGDNESELQNIAYSIYEEMSKLESLDLSEMVEPFKNVKSVLKFNKEMLSANFITLTEAEYQITTALNGQSVGVYDYNDSFINIVTSLETTSLEELMDYRIKSSITGLKIPLKTLATVDSVDSTNEIYRMNGKRLVTINAYPSVNSDASTLEKEIKIIVDKYIKEEVTVSYGGDSELFIEISKHILTASIVAIVLIYFIMFTQFNSFIKPLIIYSTIPLSFIGSFIFLVIFNQPITATSMIGVVSLLGIVVNTGILLVEYIDKEVKSGKAVKKACVDAVIRRFKPIILTSTTTIFGLIPLAITGGNFFKPMAFSLMGGVIVSTLLTLYVVPSLYHAYLNNKK